MTKRIYANCRTRSCRKRVLLRTDQDIANSKRYGPPYCAVCDRMVRYVGRQYGADGRARGANEATD